MTRRTGAAALTALMAGPGASAHAQVDNRLVFDPCAECRVDAVERLVIGKDDDSVIGGVSEVARLTDGRVAAVFSQADYQFVVYSLDGRSSQVVGRFGEGPGEYEWIRWLKPHGKRLYLFDPFLRRVTVLDEDFEVVRTTPLGVRQFLWDAEVVNDSLYVVNSGFYTTERAGFYLHSVGMDGRVIQSFDELTEAYPPRASMEQQGTLRLLVRSRDGSLWAANRNRYEIERWDPATGRRLDRFIRPVDWFPSHGRRQPIDPSRPPPPIIRDIIEDRNGWLWVLMRRTSSRWAEHVVRTPADAHPEMGEYTMDGVPGAWEEIVEVIDPETARVMAQSVLPNGIQRFLGEGSALSTHHTDDGVPYWRTWHLHLQTDPEGAAPAGGS